MVGFFIWEMEAEGKKMKKIFWTIWVAAISVTLLLFSAGTVMATPPVTCVTTPTEICADNIPEGGVTGGDDHGFCEEGSEDEWHFVITNLTPATDAGAPAKITAYFNIAGLVDIPLEKITGGTAHYRLTGQYLTDTLEYACGILPAGSCYGNFNLSHAPCGTTTTTDTTSTTTTDTTVTTETTSTTEVGGKVYPVNQFLLMVPAIALGVALLSVVGIIIRRRMIQK